MQIFENFYFNFYTLAVIGGITSWTLCTLFIFLLKGKSKPTKILGWNVAVGAIGYYGYLLSQGFVAHTSGRLITLIPILFFYTIQPQFFFYFYNKVHPRFMKFSLYFLSIIAILVSVIVIHKSRTAEVFFRFDGHYYEYDMPVAMKIYGATVLFLVLYTLIASIWNLIKAAPNERFTMSIFVIGVFVEAVISAVLNVLNRSGFISRQFFFTNYMLVVMLGFFIILIAYINKTKDRTSFMFKIVSISYIVFVILFNFFAFITMDSVNQTYDQIKHSQSQLAVQARNYGEDVHYVLRHNPEMGSADFLYNINNESLSRQQWQPQLMNSYLYHRFAHRKLKTIHKSELSQLSQRPDMKYSRGYIAFLSEQKKYYPELTGSSFWQKQDRLIRHERGRIIGIPTEKFSQKIMAVLEKMPPSYAPFKEIIQQYLQKSNAKNKQLKQEILQYFQPMKPARHRKYRHGKSNFYVVYHVLDKQNPNIVYEVGFSYLSYRQYLHNVAVKLFYLYVVSILLVIFGIPIFLSGALITPLKALLEGLREVRKGHLQTEVPVFVQDEIGFLAGSFNNMVKSIRDAKGKLEEYSQTLEIKVEERTQELMVSFKEIEELKEKQDGDYFLTTLLMKPLSINRSINERKIRIDFFVKQKKEFEFRKRKHEIGGDICIAHDIKLKGKWYTAFLNADAMGKSMQGAGGVLVLGAVFQSILQRTMSNVHLANVYPENWIKNAFKEMHKIFESFDGSMLISLIFGLVEEDSGLVYYINAEHPWLILYRDGKADFLENEMYFRKLGTAGMENDLFISTFLMMPGDMLIMGSDGKDDLVLESSAENGRVINEDETKFLKSVEETSGDLQKIFQTITEHYELMDDFSLLSISYPLDENYYVEKEKTRQLVQQARRELRKKNANKAIEILEQAYDASAKNSEIGKFLTKLYIKQKEHKKAAQISREYLLNNEVDTAIMIKASYSMKLNREFEDAIEIAERVKLREPNNLRNLIHLTDLYAYTGNYPRAQKLLAKIFKIDPKNQKAQKIKTILEDRMHK